MGAEAILQIMKTINLDEIRNKLLLETQSSSGQRRKKASKQLRVVETFRNSGNKPGVDDFNRPACAAALI